MVKPIFMFTKEYCRKSVVECNRQLDELKEEISYLISSTNQYRDYMDAYNIKIEINIEDIHIAYKLRTKIRGIHKDTKDSRLFRAILNRIYTATIQYYKITKVRNNFKLLNSIPYHMFKSILIDYNTRNANAIIMGHTMRFYHSMGAITIKRYSRKFVKKDSTPNFTIDWGSTWKNLETIANIQETNGTHNLYTTYKQGKISKEQFKIAMKEFTYSSTNTHLPKYFIYKNDDEYLWWTWHSRNTYIPGILSYTFSPTSYINTLSRNFDDVLADSNNIDEILNNKDLGNIDKTALVNAFDDKHKYIYNHE